MTARPVHIEGMGWLGSALATCLDRDGTPFTWNDIDHPVNAWSCSTGAVYPAGDARSVAGMEGWHRWWEQELFPAPTVAQAALVYFQKAPPHGARYRPVPLPGPVKMAPEMAYAVDVPGIVRLTRARYADRRLGVPPPDAPRIIAHGFTRRLGSYMWGWAAPVRLEVPDAWRRAADGRRVMLFGRKHHFQICYAYPIPSRPGWWWAGSELRRQKTPKRVQAHGYVERWLEAFPRLYPGARVTAIEEPLHGWRPVARPGDPETFQDHGTTATLPPLWHSGVRWAPPLVEAAAAWAARHSQKRTER